MKKIVLFSMATLLSYYFVGCSKSNSNTLGPMPTITGFTPKTDTVRGLLTITGNNFSAIPGNNIVKINGISASVNSATETQLVVTIPPGVAGSCSITITIAGQTATSASNLNIVSPNQLLILGKWVYAASNRYDSIYANRIVTRIDVSNLNTNTNYLAFTGDGKAYSFQQGWGLGHSGAFYRDTVNYTIFDKTVYLSYPAGTNYYGGTPFTYPAYQDTITIKSLTANSFALTRNYHFKHFSTNSGEVKLSIDSLIR